MPQCPAQVTQGSRADVLPVLISEGSVIDRIVERSCPLEVPSSAGKITRRYKGGAERAMRQAERSSVVMALCLREKLLGCHSNRDFTADIVASPYPVQDGEFL